MSISPYSYERERFKVIRPFDMTLEEHMCGVNEMEGRVMEFICRSIIANHLLKSGYISPLRLH